MLVHAPRWHFFHGRPSQKIAFFSEQTFFHVCQNISVFRIRILWFGSSILGWIPIWIRIQGFDDQRLKKIYSWQKKHFFDQKIAIHLSLGLHKDRPIQATVIKREHPNEISYLFSILSVIFYLLDPEPDTDPLTWLNPDPIWIRIRNTATY